MAPGKKADARQVNARQVNARPDQPHPDESMERWLIEFRRDLCVAHNLAVARIDFLIAKAIREKH